MDELIRIGNTNIFAKINKFFLNLWELQSFQIRRRHQGHCGGNTDKTMTINIIAAVSLNGAIGRDNALLWHLSGDMKFFRQTTTGHCVIMGRKTFESIGRPLPRRTNIVISRGEPELPEGVLLAHSLEEALEMARACGEGCGDAGAYGSVRAEGSRLDEAEPQCFILGGGQIYAEAMRVADRLYITEVLTTIDDADTFFPAIDPEVWKLESRGETITDDVPDAPDTTGGAASPLQYRFCTYVRR